MSHFQTKHISRPLRALIKRIVDQSDSAALNELHQRRTIFSHFEQSSLRLSEYLRKLCEHVPSNQSSFAAEAYSITLEKFLNVPNESSRVDCRKYYATALRTLEKHTWHSELETDKRLSQILQHLVSKHFSYALKEAARSQSGFSRYNWHTPHGTFTVMMPKSLSGTERRNWLEQHVSEHLLKEHGARQEIQQLIRTQFSEVLLDALDSPQISSIEPRMPWDYLEHLDIPMLAQCVAIEKVDTLAQQRRAIQQLGSVRLKSLILDVFATVQSDSSTDAQLAQKYKMSPATFSRFAGRKWNTIPDLWKNTAGMLAHHPKFKEYCA